jgi:DNA processing protein
VQGRYLHPLEYPIQIRALRKPPRALNVVGDITPAAHHVAIVGAREATSATIQLAKRLAAVVVEAGGVVVSGGADGTDAAAHEGAIEAKGRTWAVLGCGAPNVTPVEERQRFVDILAAGGALIRPFPERTPPSGACFKSRNRVLVALAEIVVIAQAGDQSGTENAANHARRLGKELWVVPGVGDPFVYSWKLIDQGARMLRHESELAERLCAPQLDGNARTVYDVLRGSKHPDEIALLTGLSTSAVTTALLTLALGDVVVEDSAGLFRRKNLL